MIFPDTHVKFRFGDAVRKTSGSQWHGRIVGWYSSTLTKEGYAVENLHEVGSVQIYPASALELTPATPIDTTHVYYTDGRLDVYVAAIISNHHAVCIVRDRYTPKLLMAEIFTLTHISSMVRDYAANWVRFADATIGSRYDGCSGGMSALWYVLFESRPPWEYCCDEHDQAYAVGGTKEQRWAADRALLQCVTNNGHPIWAFIMWCAVRVGGHPILPMPWRWGFTKPYYKGYDK